MSEFNVGDKVISKGYPYLGEEVGIVVGIDTRENVLEKYLIKFNSLNKYEGWTYRDLCDNRNYVIEPYEGYAQWVDEDILVKVEEECKAECKEDEHEEECEEDIKIKFDKVREQKKELVRGISGKILEMTLEIKELEAEIEKIKKEWHLE